MVLAAVVCAAVSHARNVPSEPGVRLMRSTSGTKGHQEGARHAVDDPRTVFSPAEGRQVIVSSHRPGAALQTSCTSTDPSVCTR